jgi:ubiquinone/menaquinone biosynthesis C-methylase UbiE
MSASSSSHRDEPSTTYFVQGKQNKNELARLILQDELITSSMKGIMPEQLDPGVFRDVLDVGCASGSWVIEAAKLYPAMSLTGVDINPRMIDYARAQARKQQVSDRVTFAVMDALRPLQFPDASFDVVNMRFCCSFIRTWEWSSVLSELLRITRRGGVIRLTEPEIVQCSSSPAHMSFFELFLSAMYNSGHLFVQKTDGVTAYLADLLKPYGCQQVQAQTHALEFRAGTPEGQVYRQDSELALTLLCPFIQKWGTNASNIAEICQQAIVEMQQNDFRCTWKLLTACGVKA